MALLPAKTSQTNLSGNNMSTITQANTLPVITGSSYAKQAFRIVGGSLFLIAMAKIAVGGPIPMTLGTLGVMLVAMTLGAREGIAAIVLYLAYGAMGFPVFAAPGAAGIAYMLGGTGGFLVGYLALAAITGAAADRGITRTIPGAVLAILAGTIVLFACGGRIGQFAAAIADQSLPARQLPAGFLAGTIRHDLQDGVQRRVFQMRDALGQFIGHQCALGRKFRRIHNDAWVRQPGQTLKLFGIVPDHLQISDDALQQIPCGPSAPPVLKGRQIGTRYL
jgi:biotin transport system substrate-specific component